MYSNGSEILSNKKLVQSYVKQTVI